MTFKDLDIKPDYRSFHDDIVNEFYIPVLKKAVKYDRAVGFFSSTALLEIADGIDQLIINNGKIRILTSPKLSEEDIDAIEKGYDIRKGVLERSLLRNLINPTNSKDQERLNLIANLIADDILDIKAVLINNKNNVGMYHEKLGIVTDSEDNKIVFTGSMNETITGLKINYESLDVFCSWKGDTDRIDLKERYFEQMWDNEDENIVAIDIPSVKEKIIQKYKKSKIDYRLEKKEDVIWIKKPAYLDSLYDYQKEAIENWEKNKFRGIFDMATGTGKTLTALGGLSVLANRLQNKLGIVVICPYQHLVEQWVEDIKACGVDPIICYSSYNWKNDLKKEIRNFNYGIRKNIFIITTNMTFSTDYFQENISTVNKDLCLVVDEAHNIGTENQRRYMNDNYKYRLALSATLERHHDEEGTEKLFEYFGDKCIEYSLERAINEDKLTRYYYYPIPVSLTENEAEEYENLTRQIGKYLNYNDKKNEKNTSLEMLLIKRSRIIAGAYNKIGALKEIISEKYINDTHMLVYCGSANVKDFNYIEGKPEDEEIRQIDAVIHELGNNLNMRVRKFTSEEDSNEREQIKKSFAEGNILQALIAIRCLDEGVNIPSIKTAFILASSTNPKEYIQRRGRVLRKYKNKDFAYIYDFVVLPRSIDENIDVYDIKDWEKSLIQREFDRINEFSSIAENGYESDKLKKILKEKYGLYKIY